MSFFTIWTVLSAVTYESGWAPYVSQSILFPIFYVSFTIFFTLYFHTVISVFSTSIYAVFVINCTRKKTLLIKWFNFVFTEDLPSISQTYKLRRLKRIYIKLQSSCFFFFEVYFEPPKMFTNQLNNICNGLHFFVCSFTKIMLLYKYFSKFLLRFVL